MKLTTFFVLVGCIHLNAASYSQTITLEARGYNLREVFNVIQQQTDYKVIYNVRFLTHTKPVDISVKQMPLEAFLKKVLDHQALTYSIRENTILIGRTVREADLVVDIAVGSTIQQRVVVGRVTDESGQPLEGVTVSARDASALVTTDRSGYYRVELPSGATQLFFTMIGFDQAIRPIGNQKNLDVKLKASLSNLDEVVVVGYGTQQKANITGAVSTIGNDELMEVPVASTTQALAGRLPGLISKQSEGKPGSTPNLSIRGFGTPLVIVDGIEQSNYHNIDPNEIESFSVLKDAAAAVYGARAGNGVILITTKRGSNALPRIAFNNSASVQTPTIFPDFVDSWEYAVIQNEASEFSGMSPVYTEEEIEKFRAGTDPDYINVNQYDATIKRWSAMTHNNLNVSGGSERVKYFLSAGHLFQDGIYKSNGVNLNRYNIRSNIDVKITDNLSMGLDLSTRNTVSHDVPFSSHDIFQTIGTTTNRFPDRYPDPNRMPFVGRSSHNPRIKINPDLSGYDNTNRQYRTGILTLGYHVPFVNGLSVKLRGNYLGDESYNKRWTKPYSTYYYDRINDSYSIASTGGIFSLREQQNRARELTFQSLVDYQHTFGNHEITALFVGEVIDSRSNWFNAYKDGFITGALDEMFAGSNENMSTNGSGQEESRVSYVSRLNYAYQSKYLLEGTLRYDGSSRFAEASRWALFPSILLGWRLSDEPFIKRRLSFIDDLKLRLTYSHTGYDRNASPYQYLSTYRFSTQYIFGNVPYKTIRSNGIENASISWEDIYTYNVGLDLELWNGLLGGEFDLFYRLRDGILGTRTAVLPNTFGATLPQENVNSIDNRGVELVFRHRNQINEFMYRVNANFSWTRAKYVDYAEQVYDDLDEKRLYQRVGNWTNRTFGYRTAGFFQNQEEIDNSNIDYDLAENSTIKPGMIKYIDENGDGVINWRDQVELGKGSTPDIMYGLNLDVSYRGFELSMLWQGAAGFNILFEQNMRTLTINNVWNSYKFLYNGRWTPDNPNATFPRTTNGHHSYHNRTSDVWLKPGDYIRLKSVSFGYNLPERWLHRIKVKATKIYVAGYNVLTFDRLGHFPFDPEGVGSSWTYPLYKSYSFGLNIVI